MKRFKKVYIEITNQCNLSCSFCPKTNRAFKRKNKADFERVLKAIAPYTDHIYLHLMGEPTMHPELEAFLDLSKAYDLKVNLTTNGTLLHQVAPVLLNAPALRQVNISLHSFESNEQGMTLEGYVKRITDFVLKAKEQGKVICSLRLWNMDDETLKGNNALNQDIISLLEQHLEIDFSIREALLEKKGIKLSQNVYLNMAKRFEWPEGEKELLSEEVFCYGMRQQIGILSDGTVVPCCLDSEGQIALGNIYETDLEEIIHSPRAQALYEGFSNRRAVEELCKRCGYAMRYHTQP